MNTITLVGNSTHVVHVHPRACAPGHYNAYTSLLECYANPSTYKITAWHECKTVATRLGAVAYITSYNCNFFTVMFDAMIDGRLMRIRCTAYHWEAYYLD